MWYVVGLHHSTLMFVCQRCHLMRCDWQQPSLKPCCEHNYDASDASRAAKATPCSVMFQEQRSAVINTSMLASAPFRRACTMPPQL